tara:strand:+ start:3477 stop:5684 length:2208 start_codon:yes stop_codon:yes gene_type:complete
MSSKISMILKKKHFYVHTFILHFFLNTHINAQEFKNLYSTYTDKEVELDGKDDEEFWNKSLAGDVFWQNFPSDSLASQNTEVKIVHTDNYIYAFIKAFNSSNKYGVPSLERDSSVPGNDAVILLFDTYKDGNNAFWFESNPVGLKKDALISEGGDDIDMTWDIKWEVETYIGEGFYQCEFKIPLKSLKFPDGAKDWKLQVFRADIFTGEFSLWNKVPINQKAFDLAFFGNLIFDNPLGKSKTQITVIPYTSGIKTSDFNSNINYDRFSFGGDAKVTIGNGMNLDLTFNPDFSQVEVDDQIINITRFEINLPEKRQFFIQNSDLFSSFGDSRDSRTFFSRRIGVARDENGNIIENKISAGLRLSGKISKNTRLGVLNMYTNQDLKNNIKGNTNSVIALQQKLFSRSNISLLFINRQNTDKNELDYNRVVGIDYNLLSKDAVWDGKFYFHNSFSDLNKTNPFSTGFTLSYNTRNNSIYSKVIRLGEGFESDLGFIRRKGIFKNYFRYERRFWLKNKQIRSINVNSSFSYTDKPENKSLVTDRNYRLGLEFDFNSMANIEVSLRKNYTQLEDSFNPLISFGSNPLPANSSYDYSYLEFRYRNDQRKKISYGFEFNNGDFYNGKRMSLRTELNYRFEPIFQSSFNLSINKISLPEFYGKGRLLLATSKFNLTFNKSLFWMNYLQYSNVSKNFGINSRLQWRFAPLSDLYIVFNDNYLYEDSLIPSLRSISFKLSYWLDL